MRIAIIHEPWGAGAARCTADLKRELGGKHEILYFPQPGEANTADYILTELTSFRPDVVNCHSFYSTLPYEFLSVISNTYPTCFTVHDPRPIGTMLVPCWNCEQNTTCRGCPMVSPRWRQLFRNSYYRERKVKRETHNKCSGGLQVVAPSKWMLSRLAAQELKRFQLHHIPYGIDLDHFRFTPNTRREFELPSDRPIILFSSWYESPRTIGLRKGLADLANAFISHVVAAMPEAILAVAGESFVPNHPNVRPLGFIEYERLPRLLSAADVYVTPTLADNLPYTVLEAMSCQRPIIATNVGGIPEQVVHGETGLLVPPSQPIELGMAIIEILSAPPRSRLMGEKARSRVETIYSMTAFVRAYERLFTDMASHSERDVWTTQSGKLS
jgi:glycosyltransferase involved in cell wall biosynthesis